MLYMAFHERSIITHWRKMSYSLFLYVNEIKQKTNLYINSYKYFITLTTDFYKIYELPIQIIGTFKYTPIPIL